MVLVSKTIQEWVSIYLVLLSPVGCEDGTAKLINVKSCVRAHELPLCDSNTMLIHFIYFTSLQLTTPCTLRIYEGWNFNSGNYLFTTDTK